MRSKMTVGSAFETIAKEVKDSKFKKEKMDAIAKEVRFLKRMMGLTMIQSCLVSVFLENAGETAYLLQIDAALVYAAGREITQADYSGLNSPYNLYLHTGLPPTPIANPGLASIKAALQPADTNYYFYVLGADGKHIYNETLAGHIASGG